MQLSERFSMGPIGSDDAVEPIGVFIISDLGKCSAEATVQSLGLDSFDQRMAALAPTIQLADESSICFDELEAFHPDALCERSTQLAELINIRSELKSGATAQSVAARLATAAGWARNDSAKQQTESEPASDDSLASLLGGARTNPTSRPSPSAGLDKFLRDVVDPHRVDNDRDGSRQSAINLLEQRLGQLLRELLHDPKMLSLEAKWRGLHWLLSQIDLGEEVEIFLIPSATHDADSDSLATTIEQARRDHELQARRCLVVVDHLHTADKSNHTALTGWAKLAGKLDMPLVTGGSLELLDIDKTLRRWQAVREAPGANALVVALPGFILRLPYGAENDPIDAFKFEELSGDRSTDRFVWGNAALACAAIQVRLMLGEDGPSVIDDLPTFTYRGIDEPPRMMALETEVSSAEQLADRLGVTVFQAPRKRSYIQATPIRAVGG